MKSVASVSVVLALVHPLLSLSSLSASPEFRRQVIEMHNTLTHPIPTLSTSKGGGALPDTNVQGLPALAAEKSNSIFRFETDELWLNLHHFL